MIKKIKKLFARATYVWAANSVANGVHSDGAISCEASGDIVRGDIVMFDSAGKIQTADGTGTPIGIADDNAKAGDFISVLLLGSRTGTLLGVASGAISAGDTVYSEAGGKIGASAPESDASKFAVGVAITSGVAGDEIEIAHCVARAISA